jgi:protein-L-isoaspartate O-methyltransferase
LTAFDHSLVSAEAFENRYRENPDPWNYRASPYQRGKYQVTLEALSRPRYGNAFEPACSVGELTAMLASRCSRLLATDVSETAVQQARRRCAGLHHVRIERRDLRADFDNHAEERPFDLIVFSEVGYYFDIESLSTLARRLADALCTNGELIAVHWRGHSSDHVLHGDEVHRCLLHTLPLQHRLGDHHPGYRLDSWLKTSEASGNLPDSLLNGR